MRAISTALALFTILLASPAHADRARSMKGWELYTWFDMSCSASPQAHSAPNDDSWCVALVVGTNRQKTAAEIKRAAHPWSALPTLLGSLAKGEDLAWVTTPGVFDQPASTLRKRALAMIRRQHLTVAVVQRK